MLLVGELSHRRAGSSSASAEYFRIYHECGTNGTFTAPFMCRDQSPHQPVLLPAMQHPGKLFIRKLFPPRPITQLPAPNAACTRALLPAQTCRARHTSPTTSVAANPPQGSRSKGSTRSIACTGPASSQPGTGLGLHLHPWKRSQAPAAQMPVVQGILSPIFGDTRTLILTCPFAELPVNLSCLKLNFCVFFFFVKLWDTPAEHANIA